LNVIRFFTPKQRGRNVVQRAGKGFFCFNQLDTSVARTVSGSMKVT
jgi:hypothetical protein